MKLALAQINPTVGDLDGNAEKIRTVCYQAQEKGADLVVFTELALCGYPPKDLLNKPDFIERNLEALEALVQDIQGPAVLLGHVGRNPRKSGKRLTNSATLFQNGSVLGQVDKILLPDYDVFDELRYFEAGASASCIEWKGIRLGLTICEDIWNFEGFHEQEGYQCNPVQELVDTGIDCLINLSASPYRLGRLQTRHELGRYIAAQFNVPIVLVNQVGGNDDLLFDGHSFALDKQGNITAQARGFKEDLVLLDMKAGAGDVRPVAVDEEEEMYHALVMGVRDYLHKCGYRKAVVGLSGGIDSSVVAVVAAQALGSENVKGISMPSQYTASESVADAEVLARNLGIEFSVVPIKELFENYKSTLAPLFNGQGEDVTEENIQARIRGNILMAVSNKMGSMVLSTGNKSEMSVGYCTLYGDMAGGLSVIADVPKMKVYGLARWINREKEVIPQRTLDRPPTAELRPNQTDQDSLPPYEVLDEILEGYVEGHCSVDELAKAGHDPELVRQIAAKVDNNEYKRKQAAPGLKVTAKAFGTGRRNPIAQRYRSGR